MDLVQARKFELKNLKFTRMEYIMSTIISSAMRANLNSASVLMSQMESTQERVSTGRKVNSASDDAYAYFTENSLRDTSSELDFYHKEMDRGIKTIKAATSAIQSMQDLADRAEGLLRAALETSDRWERDGYRQQFEDVMDNIGEMGSNAEYRGVNLLGGTTSQDSISMQLNADGTNFLQVAGADFTSVEDIDSAAYAAGIETLFGTGIDTAALATHAITDGGFTSEDANLVTDLQYAVGDTITFTLSDGTNTDTYEYTVDDDSTISTYLAELNGSGFVKAEMSGTTITYTAPGNNTNVTIGDAGTATTSLVDGAAAGGVALAFTSGGAGADAYFNLDANITAQLASIDALQTTLTAKEGELSNFEVIAESFYAFTEQMISLLEEGADNLVVADVEEESVKLNVLQTRQQLAMISISLGTQAEQNILRLF